MAWPFGALRMFGYNLVYADPAWTFETYSEKGAGRSPQAHYDTMSVDEIAALPVGQLAQGNAACALWVVDPLLPEGLHVLKRWGFRFATVLFTWTKEKPSGAEHIGTGYYTRANPEMCLLGIAGSMPVRDRGVRQWRHSAVQEHSRKPDEFADDLVRLFGDVPRCELFARRRREGWDGWGNEIDGAKARPVPPAAVADAPLFEDAP